MSNYKDVAGAGAMLLDNMRPGWYKGINVDTLDMNNPCKCILGQTWPKYVVGLIELNLSVGQSEDIKYGFDLEGIWMDENEVDNQYAMLGEAWKDEVTKRLDFDAEVASLELKGRAGA